MLSDLGLVHMNGRVYDPVLGRFLSADPNIDGVSDAQGYNRYSYVGNNPMNATDPTGYFKLKEILPAIVAVVVTAVTVVALGPAGGFASWSAFFGGLKTGLATSAAFWGGAAGGFASGFSGSLLNGGSLGSAFKAGLIGAAVGAATAWAAQGIAGYFNEGLSSTGWLSDGAANWGGRTLAHATVGGAASAAQGGEFRHGFFSSAASAGIMHIKAVAGFLGGSKGGGWIAARTAAAAAIGGTAFVLGGGKFANGAVTSAFQHLFNAEASKVPQEEALSGRMVVFAGLEGLAVTKKYFASNFGDSAAVIPVRNEADFAEAVGKVDFTGIDRIVIVAESEGKHLWFGTKAGFALIVNIGGGGTAPTAQAFSLLASKIGPRAAITLISCRTGQSFAPALAKAHKMTVYSPTIPVQFASENDVFSRSIVDEDLNPAQYYRYTGK